MKKFSKRLFTSLVAFCMLFSVSAVPAFAYVPWYESPKPEFTGMTGTVNVLMNKKSTNTAFAELADGEETIETDVDTGRTGNSGDKGTVSVSGVATANNALAGGGAFAISYPVTLP